MSFHIAATAIEVWKPVYFFKGSQSEVNPDCRLLDAKASLLTFCISSSGARVWCTVGAWLIFGRTESGPVCMHTGWQIKDKEKVS